MDSHNAPGLTAGCITINSNVALSYQHFTFAPSAIRPAAILLTTPYRINASWKGKKILNLLLNPSLWDIDLLLTTNMAAVTKLFQTPEWQNCLMFAETLPYRCIASQICHLEIWAIVFCYQPPITSWRLQSDLAARRRTENSSVPRLSILEAARGLLCPRYTVWLDQIMAHSETAAIC